MERCIEVISGGCDCGHRRPAPVSLVRAEGERVVGAFREMFVGDDITCMRVHDAVICVMCIFPSSQIEAC